MNAITKAMILAAGFGTRLKPLTDSTPKPLLTYKNKPMIAHVIGKLANAGIKDITVNTHHLHEMMSDYFKNEKFDAQINLVHEKEILGTGGGIKNASRYLSGSGNFLVHNVDVDSDIDLNKLFEEHAAHNALATLCVKKRNTARPLLADEENYLAGRVVNGESQLYKQPASHSQTAFSGVYMLNDRVFSLFPHDNNFDIIPFLLDMVSKGEKVFCFDTGNTYWKDLGKIEDFNRT